MGVYVKEAGVWKVVAAPPRVHDAGAWALADRMFVKHEGEWGLVWPQPASLVVTAAAPTWDTVDVAWTPSGVTVDYYQLLRGSTVLAANTTALAYADTGLNGNSTYTYTVRGYRDGAVQVTATQSVQTPARSDMGLAADTAPRWDQVVLVWTDPSGGISEYRLTWNDTLFGVPVTPTVTLYQGPAKTFTDTMRSPNHEYLFTLQALRGGDVVSPSDSVMARTRHRVAPTVSVAPGANSVAFTWTDADQYSIDTYKMYRGGALKATLPAATKTWVDGQLVSGVPYDYELRSYRGAANIGPTVYLDDVTTSPAAEEEADDGDA